MTDELPAYARLISEAMERQEITRHFLAKRTDVSVNTIRNTVLGAHRPSPENLTKMAVGLGIDPGHALRIAGYPEAMVEEMQEQAAPNQLDLSDLNDQDRNLVQRVVDALRIQEKHRK